MVNTVAPVWDGNETWLVLGGATLMAAFPLAYSVLLSALYIPIFFMASYDGGSFHLLSPFILFTGVGLIVAYALLGCT
jgi:cytochrome bd-type quinol oxidase subunit 2